MIIQFNNCWSIRKHKSANSTTINIEVLLLKWPFDNGNAMAYGFFCFVYDIVDVLILITKFPTTVIVVTYQVEDPLLKGPIFWVWKYILEIAHRPHSTAYSPCLCYEMLATKSKSTFVVVWAIKIISCPDDEEITIYNKEFSQKIPLFVCAVCGRITEMTKGDPCKPNLHHHTG